MFDAVDAGVMTNSFKFSSKDSTRRLEGVLADSDESNRSNEEDSLANRATFRMESEADLYADNGDDGDDMGINEALLQFGITVTDYNTIKVRKRGGG